MKKLLLIIAILVNFVGLQAKDTVEEMDNLFYKLIMKEKYISCEDLESILGQETDERIEELREYCLWTIKEDSSLALYARDISSPLERINKTIHLYEKILHCPKKINLRDSSSVE